MSRTLPIHQGSEPDWVIAKAFHEAYEALAPVYGYRTREASAKPWDEVPDNNRGLMCATVRQLLRDGVIVLGPGGKVGPDA